MSQSAMEDKLKKMEASLHALMKENKTKTDSSITHIEIKLLKRMEALEKSVKILEIENAKLKEEVISLKEEMAASKELREEGEIQETDKVAIKEKSQRNLSKQWRWVADGKRTPSWQKFRSAICKAFEPANADFHARFSLRRLSQTGSLAAYITEFQRLTLEIETLSPSDKLHSFIDGLEPNLKDDVHKFDPATLDAAIAYVERLGDNRRQGRNFFPGERSFNNNRSFQRDNRGRYSQNQQRSSQNYQPVRPSSSGQFFGNQSSEQQSFRPRFSGQATPSQTRSSSNGFRNRGRPRQDRRRNDSQNFQRETTSGQHASTSSAPSTSQSSRSGLCTICGGNHRWYECPKRPNPSTTRRNTNMESCPETEQCSTSTPDKGKQAVRAVRVSKVVSSLMLNANTNVSVPINLSNQVLSLLGFVGNHPLNVLVDSGCSTNFVSTMLVSKLRLPTQQSVEAFQVELTDGSHLKCNKKVQQLEFQIQDYKDQLGFSVMPLSHYDMILGQSWLYQYDPIISFRDHSIRLFHRNQEVELRGLFNTQPTTMVSAMQVKRLARKRDCTTALVMLREAEDDTEVHSAYHPQMDGQTERVNQILEEMLRHYIQNRLASWEEYLPLVEFAYNNAPHSVTGMTPFQAAYGHTPLVPTNFVLQHKVALADQLVQEMQDILVQVRDKLIHVQQKYQNQANKHHRHAEFNEGDMVLLYVASHRYKTVKSVFPNLRPRFYGPFKIIKKNSVFSYKLELPHSWEKLHPTFHISWLKQYIQGNSSVPELSSYVPEIEDEHVSSRQKETSSTSGMQDSVNTSKLLHHRAKEIVPGVILEMRKAIQDRDFATFARICCADSNQFHATCLDTSPPIFYLNDTSKR
ncbi:hypothetical protein L7F22_010927 [Adiantum nelumboides]|nr:hypothetical protein [Adiantum nelumboides]